MSAVHGLFSALCLALDTRDQHACKFQRSKGTRGVSSQNLRRKRADCPLSPRQSPAHARGCGRGTCTQGVHSLSEPAASDKHNTQRPPQPFFRFLLDQRTIKGCGKAEPAQAARAQHTGLGRKVHCRVARAQFLTVCQTRHMWAHLEADVVDDGVAVQRHGLEGTLGGFINKVAQWNRAQPWAALQLAQQRRRGVGREAECRLQAPGLRRGGTRISSCLPQGN